MFQEVLADLKSLLSGPFFCLLWSIFCRCMIMPQVMNCMTTVPGLVTKKFLVVKRVGLYLMTCGCSYKSIYGFSLMLSGESPKKLFDVNMTRFEEDFNPQIIYDASCKVQSICSQNIFYDFVRFYRLRNTATTGS